MGTAVTIFVVATALALLGWLVAASRRAHRGGLSTSMTVRTARMGSMVGRSLRRRVQLRLHLLLVTRDKRKALADGYHLKSAEEAAALMGNMKGVAMKLGQILSFASDAMPEQAQQALRGLQQDAPPMDFAVARGVLEAELGGDLARFFKHIDEEPLAAASIGQVHRARLRDGSQVVLKVQYPGVDTAIESDLKFAAGVAAMIQAVHKNADSKAIVAELRDRLLDEVDYRKELQNQALFGRLWAGHPLIRVPGVYPALSTKKVLCQEYKRGLGFYDFLAAANAREKRLAVLVLNDFVFDSMHRFHVFNGDPHPGNYLFHEDGGITFLDFGCIKYFPDGFIEQLQACNRAIVTRDRAAFDASMRGLKLVLPGRPYDGDLFWEFFRYHAAPFAEDRVFTFTPEWVAKAKDVMAPSTLRHMNLPPELVLFNRITFGLNAIFQKLGASENWHRVYQRYLGPEAGHPPSLAVLGDVELPVHFLDSRPAPAAPPAAPSEPGARPPAAAAL